MSMLNFFRDSQKRVPTKDTMKLLAINFILMDIFTKDKRVNYPPELKITTLNTLNIAHAKHTPKSIKKIQTIVKSIQKRATKEGILLDDISVTLFLYSLARKLKKYYVYTVKELDGLELNTKFNANDVAKIMWYLIELDQAFGTEQSENVNRVIFKESLNCK